jgi:hypothetical protein
MRSPDFERFAVEHTEVFVSVCRRCMKFIAAAPDPLRLALAEIQHDCMPVPKKPPTKVLYSEPLAHEPRSKFAN